MEDYMKKKYKCIILVFMLCMFICAHGEMVAKTNDSNELINSENNDSHIINNIVVELTNIPERRFNYAGISFDIHDSIIEAKGICNETKLFILQESISAPAGDYLFSIGNAITSDGYQIQLFDITNNKVIRSFSSSTQIQEIQFSLEFDCDLRIRAYMVQDSEINDQNEIRLYKIASQNQHATISIPNSSNTEEKTIMKGLSLNTFPIATFIDDDAVSLENVEKYVAACYAAEIKGTIATLTNKWEYNKRLLDALKAAEREGHNIIIHAYSQDIGDHWTEKNFDIEACTEDLIHGMQMMAEAGFLNYKYWATPSSTDNEQLRSLARKVGIECRFIGNNWANDGTHPINRYKIYRVSLTISDDGASIKMSEIKDLAKECYTNNGWFIIMTHFANENAAGDYAARLLDLADYLKDLGYNIMNVSEAWSYRKWTYDTNDLF